MSQISITLSALEVREILARHIHEHMKPFGSVLHIHENVGMEFADNDEVIEQPYFEGVTIVFNHKVHQPFTVNGDVMPPMWPRGHMNIKDS